MGRVSGMGISSSQGWKKPPKMSPQEEKLASQGPYLFPTCFVKNTKTQKFNICFDFSLLRTLKLFDV
jgi:hypothetical protein